MSRRRPDRGFSLIVVLLLLAILLVLGIGFLGRGLGRYRTAQETAGASQARALAMAGIEQTRVKLDKDFDYPPQSAIDQQVFSYSEEVRDVDGNVVGSYLVTLDWRYAEEPFLLLIVRSQGRVGPPDAPPEYRRTLVAEIDLAETSSTFFDIINLIDEGSF